MKKKLKKRSLEALVLAMPQYRQRRIRKRYKELKAKVELELMKVEVLPAR